MNKLVNFLSRLRPSLTLNTNSGQPSFVIELDRKIEINNREIEDRISQLDVVRETLINAADAINLISNESKIKKAELDNLKIRLDQINMEKATAEKILEVDKEAFTRLLIDTNKRTEKRSILLGIMIGFITGLLSSLLVWLITT